MAMNLFKPVNHLPIAEQAGLPEHAVSPANHNVQEMLEKENHQLGEDTSSDCGQK